ncbi:MAG: hypothetical protein JSV52_05045 [Candidatus Zixiibacteriota bacterium]|nr:MAG: hypothetical protein JSV52_05045 [candidate division Zixibacteria bacterium]
MAAEEGKKKNSSFKPITDAQRFRYIGFEVFPGKPKDLFKTDAERKKYVEGVRSKREKGETLRDQCTLLEERVSFLDRMVLTVASVIIFATLFIPWYSAYNEIVEETTVAVQQAAATEDSAMVAAEGDTLAAAGQTMTGDSAAVPATTGSDVAPPPEREGVMQQSAAEEVITSYVAKKKVHKEYSRLLGIGSFISLGSVGSYVFSSGGVVMLTAILFLIYALLCIGLPAYTLYGIYGTKGDPDQRALKLKKMLRLNWMPLILFVLALILSFFGGEYGFDAATTFTSLGKAYGPAAFLGILSWGVILSLGAFILVAVKGVEI